MQCEKSINSKGICENNETNEWLAQYRQTKGPFWTNERMSLLWSCRRNNDAYVPMQGTYDEGNPRCILQNTRKILPPA